MVTALAVGALCAACAPAGGAPRTVAPGDAVAHLDGQDEQRVRRTVLLEAAARAQSCAAGPPTPAEACWGPSDDDYRAAIEEHLHLVAARRDAAKERNAATERACAGLSAFDRDVSPLAHRSDITRVEAIDADNHVAGARVFLRRVPGLSGGKLQRIVDCHVAQAEELDHRVPEESFCPLNPPAVRALVHEAPDGYVIEMTSTDAEAAAEVLRRALELTHVGDPRGAGHRD